MGNDNKVIKTVYTLFLSVMVALFIGLGIQTFYSGPKAPDYPTYTQYVDDKNPPEDQIKKEQEYETKRIAYEEKLSSYHRNVSIIATVFAVVAVVISITQQKRLKFLSDGVMLGGLITLLYSVIRSVASQNKQLIFITVTVGLATVIYVGFHRFVHEDSPKSEKKK